MQSRCQIKSVAPRPEDTGRNNIGTQAVYHQVYPEAIGKYRHFIVVPRMVINNLVTANTMVI